MKNKYKVTFTINLSGELTPDETMELVKEQWETTESYSEGDTIEDIVVTPV